MHAEKMQQMLELFGEYNSENESAGSWLEIETKRHTDNRDLFEAMLREAYDGVTMVVAGHHIMVMRAGEPLPLEVASADTLIFDHFIAQKVWKDRWREVLAALAVAPVASRDILLRQLYESREG